MIIRAAKLRLRRRLRFRKRQVEAFGVQAERELERNFFKKLERLGEVRRFIAVWILFMVLLGGCVAAQIQGLSGFYQRTAAAPGGTLREGVVGLYSNANPIYATSGPDVAVSKLIFSGLLTYDQDNNLVGDLAKDWAVDDAGTTYTVHLKPGLTWHDGKPLTSADVAFTYQVIQSPDARSPLNPSWQGIQVFAPDPLTVQFVLPNLLSSFPYSLTNGIVPKHILGGVQMPALRSDPFNTSRPVGSGPFRFSKLEVKGGSAETREESIALARFDKYHLGTPKLASFVVHTFRSDRQMVRSFKDKQIDSMAGLQEVPNDIGEHHEYSLPLTAQVMTFFKTNSGVLADAKVRQALVQGANRDAIITKLGYATWPVRSPLLMNQLGYNAALAQTSYNPAAANAALDADGWVVGQDGIRTKQGAPLAFRLHVQDNSEYVFVARQLAKQWRNIGADVEPVILSGTEFQTALALHGYEALLHGITVGKDPDMYAYWDSAQADGRAANRLNFSEWKSTTADTALEAGRTRLDPALRSVKYQPFLQAWQTDAPALGLYQPRLLYISRGPVYGLTEHFINADIERYTNVQNWMVRERRVSDQL